VWKVDAAHAQSASQDVTVVVREVNSLSVSSGVVTLTVDAARPGAPPSVATDSTTTFNVTTNGIAKKITGALDAAYPEGIQLRVTLEAPEGGQSLGMKPLGTESVDLITCLARSAGSDMRIH
jgi:hypothetical protein